MNENPNTGFFSSFNARHLGAEEAARSFVPNTKFKQLLGTQNSLLVGARGSGKTHLLKMLQPKALNAWEHSDADEIRRTMTYFGVFIPADEAWSHQIESTASALDPTLQERFRAAMFATHVQRSVIDCFLQLTHDRPTQDRGFAKIEITNNQEFELCRTLAQSWSLTPRIHSLLGLRQAIIDRCADLYDAPESAHTAELLISKCNTHAVQTALRGINAFDSAIGRYDGRWCLMFDELEIAPAAIQETLFRSLRSTDQRLIFKLALSPSTQASSLFHDVLGPSRGNDFEEISLYYDAKESTTFCENLWRNLTIGSPALGQSPELVLGHSTYYGPDSPAPYSKHGQWQKASSILARKDASYRRFMDHYGIDPDALGLASAQQRDAVVRKIGPMVGFREFMLRPSTKDGKPDLRRDKSKPAQIYSGWEVLCTVCEGNPRWFTGIAKNLLITRDAAPSRRDLSKESQYAALTAASRKFLDYVATIPSNNRGQNAAKSVDIKGLLDTLVDYFHREATINEFSLEPILSFRVDAGVPEQIRRAIFDGLYSGAFVPVGDVERQFAFSQELTGQRLRPTYLLAPLLRLPLRSGKSRNLTSILRRASATRSAERRIHSGQAVHNSLNDRQERLFDE